MLALLQPLLSGLATNLRMTTDKISTGLMSVVADNEVSFAGQQFSDLFTFEEFLRNSPSGQLYEHPSGIHAALHDPIWAPQILSARLQLEWGFEEQHATAAALEAINKPPKSEVKTSGGTLKKGCFRGGIQHSG